MIILLSPVSRLSGQSCLLLDHGNPFGAVPDRNRCLNCCFADILWNRKSPLLLAQIFAKIVRKSKNTDDAERIVWYNKGGQKGAG